MHMLPLSWKLLIFDLDGLLVNTEMMHFRAYKAACQGLGGKMDWTFDTYFQVAGSSSTGLQERLSRENPYIFRSLSWEEFYEKKQQSLFELLRTEPIPLMPGVKEFLESARDLECRMACVTHSRKLFVDTIRMQHPFFSCIHSWYTRESYDRAKPFPDGYIKAVEEEGVLPDQAIGFEDSLRGIQAQIEAGIHPVLVTKDEQTKKTAKDFPSVLIVESLYEVHDVLFGKNQDT